MQDMIWSPRLLKRRRKHCCLWIMLMALGNLLDWASYSYSQVPIDPDYGLRTRPWGAGNPCTYSPAALGKHHIQLASQLLRSAPLTYNCNTCSLECRVEKGWGYWLIASHHVEIIFLDYGLKCMCMEGVSYYLWLRFRTAVKLSQ